MPHRSSKRRLRRCSPEPGRRSAALWHGAKVGAKFAGGMIAILLAAGKGRAIFFPSPADAAFQVLTIVLAVASFGAIVGGAIEAARLRREREDAPS